MAPFTPLKLASIELPQGVSDADDELLDTPSSDQGVFPDNIFDPTPIPFPIKAADALVKLEDQSDINDHDQDEDQVMNDAIANLNVTEPNKQQLVLARLSDPTQDFYTNYIKPAPRLESAQPIVGALQLLIGLPLPQACIVPYIAGSPSDAEIGSQVAQVVVRQPRKRVRIEIPLELRRWSRRIAGPAKEFNRYFRRLPLELQRAIWGYAAANTYHLSRCVYIRNRALRTSQHTFEDGVMNKMPYLWNACGPARDIMVDDYELMFARVLPMAPKRPDNVRFGGPLGFVTGPAVSHLSKTPFMNNAVDSLYEYDYTNQQLVNPDSDVIILEPCCAGCRAFHCVKKQFNILDRNSVRFLAVQTESPSLSATTRKCWATISSCFALVEKIFLITDFESMPRDSKKRRALIRVKEGPREASLRSAFNTWKDTDLLFDGGKQCRLSEIHFVAMVEMRQPQPGQKRGEQYDFIPNRLGGPDDIVVG